MARPPAPDQARVDGDSPMTATYVRVILVEILVLGLLWAFQEYFSR